MSNFITSSRLVIEKKKNKIKQLYIQMWFFLPVYVQNKVCIKQTLRFCRWHKEQMKADACAKAYKDFDPRRFWKTVTNVSRNDVSKHVNKIGSCTGSENIFNM